MRHFAIIVAGGQGLRMGADLPKQFILIAGMPILMHTLQKFRSCHHIVLVLPEAQQPYWQRLCIEYKCDVPHSVVAGGATRYHSVLSGLKHLQSIGIDDTDLVAVHDGVRPFVSEELIAACFALAGEKASALPYLEMCDSLRHCLTEGQSIAVPRNEYIRVQTPQTFNLQTLIEAYSLGYREEFTDDASVWEVSGAGMPALIRSNEENIKITTPLDLSIAECLLAK